MSSQPVSPGVKVAIAVVVCIIILAAYWHYAYNGTPQNGPMGGVTNETKPLPSPPAVVPVDIAVTPVVSVPRVKTILVEKTTNSPLGNGDDITFQLAEIKAYNGDGRVLSASDFASLSVNADYGFPLANVLDGNLNTFMHTAGPATYHWLNMKLNEPQVITKVEVYNRRDCCAYRLQGATLSLLDNQDKLIARFNLSTTTSPQLFEVK